MSNRLLALIATAVLATATTTTGCATKKFVRTTTDPINQKVGDLDKRSSENASNIQQLDEKTSREISRVGEKASAADSRAGDAAKQASEALTKTGQAIEKADGARTMAESSMARTGQLEKYVQSLDNYQAGPTKTIYFGFDKSGLSDEAKKDLDELVQSLSTTKKFVIEVQGFTDTTGSSDYNYALSGKRADAVVRYLTTQHKIPVYRVYTIGLGKDMPAQAENKREARKLSRRVEVRVFTLAEMPQTASRTEQTPQLPSATVQTHREGEQPAQQEAQQPSERAPQRPPQQQQP